MRDKPVVIQKNEVGSQHTSINHDNSLFFSNLNHNEIVIQQLSAGQCPVGRNCIEYHRPDQSSRRCEYFKNFFQLTESRFFHKGLFCDKSKNYQKVSVLRPLDCPDSRNSCLGCERLVNIIGIPYSENTNSHLVCRKK